MKVYDKEVVYFRYQVEGHENKAVCVDGLWITVSPLLCSPVDCGKPVVPMATVACSEGTTFSKTCMFKCDKPAVLVGRLSRQSKFHVVFLL
mgnify:FL=1